MPFDLDDAVVDTKFRDVLQYIAERSDVNLDVPVRLAHQDRVHLLSEQLTPREEFVSLTTTNSLQEFIKAWWGEFSRRDANPNSQRALKPGQPFKAASNRPSMRPYYSADMVLTIEPLGRPTMNIAWLPQHGKKAEMGDAELQHFERQVRMGLRVSNFMEALLQAWKLEEPSAAMLVKIANAMVHATKTLLQIQVAQLGQFIQLRRDLFLISSSAPVDVAQQLRHAPILGCPELFPVALLTQLDERVKRSFETSLIVHTFKSTQKRKDGEKGKWGEPQRGSNRSDTDALQNGSAHKSRDVRQGSDSGFNFLPHDEWLTLLTGLQQATTLQREVPVGGRLVQFWAQWKAIGAPKRVYKWFKKGYRLPFEKGGQARADALLKAVCPDGLLSRYAADSIKDLALRRLIAELLQKEAIREVPDEEQVVFNRVFLREKPPKPRQNSLEFRLIIDLTQVNKFLRLKSFQMETPAIIRKAVRAGMWATSLDFSDAFHHIPIHPNYHKYLAFQVGPTKYCYQVCPFGLSPIPQVFTAAMTPLKHYAREVLGITIFQYLDDWLLLFSQPDQAARDTVTFAHMCVQVGMLVNLDKSELNPTQKIVHLGIEWDLTTAWVRPAPKTIQKIVTGTNLVLEAGRATLKHLESLRGKMVAAEKQTHHGRINFRVFQAQVTRALKQSPPPRWVRLSLTSLEDLAWWAESRNLVRGVPCVPPKPNCLITTDASVQGWGAFESGRTLQGVWEGPQKRLHINHKELMTVHCVLTQWGPRLVGQAIHFRLDNRTAVAYLSKQGGTHSSSLTRTTKSILRLADSFGISISTTYIAGSLNALADIHSRVGQVLKTEWCLGRTTFLWIVENNFFGPPEVDLFANYLTKQLRRYGSPNPDPQAELIDALTAPWPNEILFAFPPTTIMDRVVEKIQQERPKALLLLTPVVRTASWYPFLTTWSANKMELPHSVISLHQPHFEHRHPAPATLCLTLFHIAYES